MGRKTKGAARRQSRPSSSASSSDAPASAVNLLRLFVFALLLAPLVVAAIPSCGLLQVVAAVVLTVLGAAIGARVLPSWLSWLIATTMARSAIMVAASPLVAIWSLFWIAGVDFVLYDIILWMVQSVFTVVLLIARPVGFFWRWTSVLSPRTVEWAAIVCVIPPLSSALGVPFIVLWPTIYLSGVDRIIFYVARLIARPFTTVLLFVGLIALRILSWIGRLGGIVWYSAVPSKVSTSLRMDPQVVLHVLQCLNRVHGCDIQSFVSSTRKRVDCWFCAIFVGTRWVKVGPILM